MTNRSHTEQKKKKELSSFLSISSFPKSPRMERHVCFYQPERRGELKELKELKVWGELCGSRAAGAGGRRPRSCIIIKGRKLMKNGIGSFFWLPVYCTETSSRTRASPKTRSVLMGHFTEPQTFSHRNEKSPFRLHTCKTEYCFMNLFHNPLVYINIDNTSQ